MPVGFVGCVLATAALMYLGDWAWALPAALAAVANNGTSPEFVSDDAPVTHYVYDRATKKATFLFTDRPPLDKYKLASG